MSSDTKWKVITWNLLRFVMRWKIDASLRGYSMGSVFGKSSVMHPSCITNTDGNPDVPYLLGMMTLLNIRLQYNEFFVHLATFMLFKETIHIAHYRFICGFPIPVQISL